MFAVSIGTVALAGLGSTFGGISVLGYAAGTYNEKGKYSRTAKLESAVGALLGIAMLAAGVETEAVTVLAANKPALVIKNNAYSAKP